MDKKIFYFELFHSEYFILKTMPPRGARTLKLKKYIIYTYTRVRVRNSEYFNLFRIVQKNCYIL